MSKDQIERLEKEIEEYKQAIRDAQDALEAAERELDETLDVAARQQGLI